jgi:hypothetical protein
MDRQLRIANCGLKLLAGALACLVMAGCVEQTMTIESTPPGALVYMNDQELGRTPVTKDFTWYGDYDVQIRLEGYQTLKTHEPVMAPAWNWAPFDLLASLAPMTFKDHRSLNYTLKPLDPALNQPDEVLTRAEYLKARIEGSPYTRVPTPRTTRPSTTKPTTRPATTQLTTEPSK